MALNFHSYHLIVVGNPLSKESRFLKERKNEQIDTLYLENSFRFKTYLVLQYNRGGGEILEIRKFDFLRFFSYYRAKLAEANEIVIMWDSLLISKNIFVKY